MAEKISQKKEIIIELKHVGLFVLGMLAKPSAIYIPLLLLVLSYLKYLNLKNNLKSITFMLIFSLGILVLTSQSQMNIPLSPLEILPDFQSKILIIAHSFLFYSLSFFFPFQSSPSYPFTIESFFLSGVFKNTILLLTYPLLFSFLYFYRNNKKVLLGFSLFLLPLLPILGLVTFKYQIHWSTVSDRYFYTACLGALFLLLTFLSQFSEIHQKKYVHASLALIVLCFSSFSSFFILPSWENEENLWTRALSLYPDQSMPLINRALIYKNKNEPERALKDLNEALKLNPKHPVAYHNRSQVYLLQKRFDECEADLRKTLGLDPHFYSAILNLGNLYFYKGNFSEAINYYNDYLKKNPQDIVAIRNRANSYALQGKFVESLKDFESLSKLDSNNLESQMAYAVTLFNANLANESKKRLKYILEKNPNYLPAQKFLTQMQVSSN